MYIYFPIFLKIFLMRHITFVIANGTLQQTEEKTIGCHLKKTKENIVELFPFHKITIHVHAFYKQNISSIS